MFDILKSIVWVLVILVLAYFIMGYFGYEINTNYFSYSKKQCEAKINECTNTVLHKGIDNATACNFNCVDPQLIIKKTK